MKKNNLKRWFMLMWIGMGGFVYADPVQISVEDQSVGWRSEGAVNGFILKISGPDGFFVEKTVQSENFSLESFGEDGVYKYELIPLQSTPKQKRDDQTPKKYTHATKNVKQHGSFTVVNGMPILQNAKEKGE